MISIAPQQYSAAAVQNIQQVATPISSTLPAAGNEGNGVGEVLSNLAHHEPATTQFSTPSHHQKDTTWTKLFVGGLPYHTTDKSLRDHFNIYGDIDEAVVITDRQTGKSRGYGFVIMADRAAAERAFKEPNPIIDGRKANVNLAILGAKPRGNVAALNNAVAVANAAAALASAFPYNTATSAIHRAAATGGSLYPSVATTTTNPSTAAALFAASQYSPTALSQGTTHPGIAANPVSSAGYLYQYHAAQQQAALVSSSQYGGSPLLSFQQHPHQAATISTSSPAFVAALAAQQASSPHVQYYDTTGTGYHQTGVSVGCSTGVMNSATNTANSIAGLTSTPNVVGSGSTIVSTGAQYYGQGAQTVAGHHHNMSSAAQQAFATLAQLDYSNYLAAAAAAASGQTTQNSATSANTAYAYMPGGAAANVASSTGTAHHQHHHHSLA